MMNRFHWATVNFDSSLRGDDYLYLHIMKDVYRYCRRGYCEMSVLLMRFIDMPAAMVQRRYRELCRQEEYRSRDRQLIDWTDKDMVTAFFTYLFGVLNGVTRGRENKDAFWYAMARMCEWIEEQDGACET